MKHPQRAQSAATMQEVIQNTAAIRQGQADAELALQVMTPPQKVMIQQSGRDWPAPYGPVVHASVILLYGYWAWLRNVWLMILISC